MALGLVLQAGSEAISLVSALAKLIKELKSPTRSKDSTSSLEEVLRRLQIEAIRLSKDLENRLRILVEYIEGSAPNPQESLTQQLANLSWYQWPTRNRLKSMREECFAIYRQLLGFLDDAEAMLICANQQQLAAEAFKSSLQAKRELDQLFREPNTPLRTIVQGMLEIASRVTAELQAA